MLLLVYQLSQSIICLGGRWRVGHSEVVVFVMCFITLVSAKSMNDLDIQV